MQKRHGHPAALYVVCLLSVPIVAILSLSEPLWLKKGGKPRELKQFEEIGKDQVRLSQQPGFELLGRPKFCSQHHLTILTPPSNINA